MEPDDERSRGASEETGQEDDTRNSSLKRTGAELERLNRLYAVLSSTNQALVNIHSQIGLFSQICRTAVEFGGFKLAWIGWLNTETRAVVPVAIAGEPQKFIWELGIFATDCPEGYGPTGTAVRLGKPSIVNDLTISPDTAFWKGLAMEMHIASAAAFPIYYDGSVCGALALYSGEPGFFATKEVALLDEVAQNISFGIRRIREEQERDLTIRALEESEHRYRAIFENANDAIFIYDFQARFLEVNQALIKRVGYSRQELLGMTLSQIDVPEDAALLKKRIGILRREGKMLFEATHLSRDGKKIPVEISSQIVEYKGQPAVLSITRDISERRQMEQAARLERLRLQYLLAISQYKPKNINELLDFILAQIIAFSESQYGYIFYYDETKAESTVRVWSGAAGDQRPVHTASPVGKLEHIGIWNEVVRRRQPIILNDFAGPHPLKKGFPAGYFRLSRFMTIPVSSAGRIVAVIGVANKATDYFAEDADQLMVMMDTVWKIVERHQAEAAWRESERKLSTLIANLSGFVYRCRNDREWTMEFISDGFRSLTGFRPEDCIANAIFSYGELIHPEDRDLVWNQIQNVLLYKQPYQLMYQLRTAKGHYRWVWEQGRGVWDSDGNLTALEGFITDITERKQAEAEIHRLNTELEKRVQERTAELAAANQELENFAYSVSHDLRAPLRGIDGWSQILLEDYGAKLDDQGKEYLETVRGEAEHMAELIDALLSLSRVTRSEMHRVKVDLSQLAQKVITELRTAEPQRDVSFTVTPAMTVQADPLLMEAVFQNLIGNAWKFTSKCANPVIEVGMIEQEEMDRPGRTVYFVRDNGAGFDMAYAAKLFTPFQRLHHQEEFPGTGVGLATVKRIINRHGGEIWAEAKEDQGATFYFTL